jgi:HEAT repeat protein
MLKEVALSTTDIDRARRAMFVLMQSNRLDARTAVAEIAKGGPEPVTLAAVRELGLASAPDTGRLLADLYVSGTSPVKTQVIRALGAARQPQRLMQIVRTEHERSLRETAVAALGQAGARRQLAMLYRQEPDLKLPVITALFTAAGEGELIAIAEAERDPRLRGEAITRLKLFGTPRAKAFVESRR